MSVDIPVGTRNRTDNHCVDLVAKTLTWLNPDLFITVHCAALEPVQCALERARGRFAYVSRADNAVAFAAGNALGGKKSVVLMPDSGIPDASSVLESLVEPFHLPIGFVIGMTGESYPDWDDEPSTAADPRQQLSIAWRELSDVDVREPLDWFTERIVDRAAPAALVISPDTFGWFGAR